MELEKELAYFNEILPQLQRDNRAGSFAVIKDNQLLGVWNNRDVALKKGHEKWGNVAFLVRNITVNEPIMIGCILHSKINNGSNK